MNSEESTLIIDSKDSHLDKDYAFSLHPGKINFISKFQKESFDNALIQNVPSFQLTSIGFFNIAQALKQNGRLEVIIDQPITVMQSLDAAEIDANAKLAGFVNIEQSEFEKVEQKDGRQVKSSTIKISMTRPEKVSSTLLKKK
jgi:hypothetical protein